MYLKARLEITRGNDVRKSIGRGTILGLVSLLIVLVFRQILKIYIFPNYVLNLSSPHIDYSILGLIVLMLRFIPSVLVEELMVRYLPFKIVLEDNEDIRLFGQLCLLTLLDVGLHMFNIRDASLSGYVYYGLLQTFGGFILAYSFLKYGILGSFASHYIYNAMIPMVWCIKLFLEGW